MDKEEALSITKREIIAEIIDRRIEIILAPYNYPECYCYVKALNKNRTIYGAVVP